VIYLLRPCVELGYMLDTNLVAPHDQLTEYQKKSLLWEPRRCIETDVGYHTIDVEMIGERL
jgi:hypothetical protein